MCKSFLSANNPTTFSSKKELGNCTTRENFQHNPSLRVLTYASRAHAHVYMYVYICVYVCMNVWMCVYMDEGEKTCSVLTWHIAHGKDSHELCMWQHWVFLRTYIYTHIHYVFSRTYIYTYIHTYIHTFINLPCENKGKNAENAFFPCLIPVANRCTHTAHLEGGQEIHLSRTRLVRR